MRQMSFQIRLRILIFPLLFYCFHVDENERKKHLILEHVVALSHMYDIALVKEK